MTQRRATSRCSLGALLVVAVGCAALGNPTPRWSQVVSTAVVTLILSATVEWPRPFATGFAICGWGYLFLTIGPMSAAVKPHLLTTTARLKLESVVAGFNAVYGPMLMGVDNDDWNRGGCTVWMPPTGMNITLSTTSMAMVMGSTEVLLVYQIGFALWVLSCGVAGEMLARVVAQRQRRWRSPTRYSFLHGVYETLVA